VTLTRLTIELLQLPVIARKEEAVHIPARFGIGDSAHRMMAPPDAQETLAHLL
jgi:hypothetical protein